VVLLIVLVVFIVIVVAFTLSSGSGSKNKFKLNVLLRVLLNHIQMMSICVSFEMNWPEAIDSMLKSTVPVANIGTRFISLDCFIDQRNDDGSGENALPLIFVRLIIFTTLPVVMIIAAVIFWNIRYLISIKGIGKQSKADLYERQKLRERKSSQITTTIVVMLFIIHPSIVRGIFDLFL
jgi:hypothetical protein